MPAVPGCLPQEHDGGLAIAETGFQLLGDLSKLASVRSQADGALVLGFSSSEGAKAMVDFALGKVSCCPPLLPATLRPGRSRHAARSAADPLGVA